MSAYNYISINQFGGQQPENDPATICAFSTNIDKSFEGGVMGYQHGASSLNCQTYMADRSAKNWDIFSEHLSYNTEPLPTLINPGGDVELNGIKNLGDAFLINTAYQKYCEFPGAQYVKENLFPTNASSPVINIRHGGVPVCTIDPQNIDDDILMEKILHRQIGDDLLLNIWNTSARKGIDIRNTRVGRYIMQFILPFVQQNAPTIVAQNVRY
jgi:hypothetical protein